MTSCRNWSPRERVVSINTVEVAARRADFDDGGTAGSVIVAGESWHSNKSSGRKLNTGWIVRVSIYYKSACPVSVS